MARSRRTHSRPAPAAPPSAPARRSSLLRGAVVLGLILAIVVIIGFVVYPQVRSMQESSRGRAALHAQDYEAARQHWQRCLEVWPRDAEAHFNLARAIRGCGEATGVRHHLQQAEQYGWPAEAVELERLLFEAQFGDIDAVGPRLGNTYTLAGPEQAVGIAEALVLGYLRCQYLSEAGRWASLLTRDHSERWRSWALRGLVREQGLRPDLAAEDYRQVLERKPDQAEARRWLGKYLLQTGAAQEALSHFQTYQQAHPDDPEGRIGIAGCQLALARAVEARDTLEPVLADPEPGMRPLLLKGQIELELAGPAKAIPWLRRAEELVPRHPELLETLAAALRRSAQVEEAQGYEQRRQELLQEQQRVSELAGKLAQTTDAAQLLQLRHDLGAALLRLGEEQKGVAWLRGALRLDPKHASSHRLLADYFERIGQTQLTQFHREKAQP